MDTTVDKAAMDAAATNEATTEQAAIETAAGDATVAAIVRKAKENMRKRLQKQKKKTVDIQ